MTSTLKPEARLTLVFLNSSMEQSLGDNGNILFEDLI